MSFYSSALWFPISISSGMSVRILFFSMLTFPSLFLGPDLRRGLIIFKDIFPAHIFLFDW